MAIYKWSDIKKRRLTPGKILEFEARVAQELLKFERRNLILCLKAKPLNNKRL